MALRAGLTALTGALLVLTAGLVQAAPLQIESDDGSVVVSTLAAIDQSQAAVLREQRRQLMPAIIFVPGILGSRIIRNDGTVLWGEREFGVSPSDATLAYPSPEPIKVEVMDRFRASVFSKDVYGHGIRAIEDILNGASSVDIFAYDWRQDNRTSSRQMHEWFCRNATSFHGRPIIILAHSMGGLITKHFLSHYYNKDCADASAAFPQFDEVTVAYIGVPFHGTSKAIKAFAEGYSLLDGAFGYFVHIIDQNWLAGALNDQGYTFPSTYQLLPSYYHQCFRRAVPGADREVLPRPFRRHVNEVGMVDHDDLFDASFWKSMGWPKRRGPSFDADKYYGHDLQQFLDGAVDFACSIAGQVPPEGVNIRYYAMRSYPTDVGYIARQQRTFWGPMEYVYHAEKQLGDGTVPYVLAADLITNPDNDPHYLTGKARHADMIKVPAIWYFVADKIRYARSRADRQALDAGVERSALSKAYATAGLIPAMPWSGLPNERDRQLFQDIIDRVLSDNGLGGTDAYRIAKNSADPRLRAALYTYVAASDDVTPETAVWASNNLAHLQFQLGMWEAAAESAFVARDSDAWTELSAGSRRDVEPMLLTTEGWAHLEAGDLHLARDRLEAAANFNAPNALSGLEDLEFRVLQMQQQ